MNAVQLEFQLEQCLTTHEQVSYMRRELDEAKICFNKSRKKLFSQLNSIQDENKELKRILRELVAVLDKPALEHQKSDTTPVHTSM